MCICHSIEVPFLISFCSTLFAPHLHLSTLLFIFLCILSIETKKEGEIRMCFWCFFSLYFFLFCIIIIIIIVRLAFQVCLYLFTSSPSVRIIVLTLSSFQSRAIEPIFILYIIQNLTFQRCVLEWIDLFSCIFFKHNLNYDISWDPESKAVVSPFLFHREELTNRMVSYFTQVSMRNKWSSSSSSSSKFWDHLEMND